MKIALDFKLTREDGLIYEPFGKEKVRTVFTIAVSGKPCGFEQPSGVGKSKIPGCFISDWRSSRAAKLKDLKIANKGLPADKSRTDEILVKESEQGDHFDNRSLGITSRVSEIRKGVARTMTKHLLRVMETVGLKEVVVNGKPIQLPCVPGKIEDPNRKKWYAGKLLRDHVYTIVKATMPNDVKLPKEVTDG